ncbi:hypothetical protein Ddc_17449 [Ditylenchus destructor]|nr:hypothetical protein Ddc_17449 [Ditylenchus destructor]
MNLCHSNTSSCLAKFLRNVYLITWWVSITLTFISANLQDDYIPLSQENKSRLLGKEDHLLEEIPLYDDRRNIVMGSNQFIKDIAHNSRTKLTQDVDGSQSGEETNTQRQNNMPNLPTTVNQSYIDKSAAKKTYTVSWRGPILIFIGIFSSFMAVMLIGCYCIFLYVKYKWPLQYIYIDRTYQQGQHNLMSTWP